MGRGGAAGGISIWARTPAAAAPTMPVPMLAPVPRRGGAPGAQRGVRHAPGRRRCHHSGAQGAGKGRGQVWLQLWRQGGWRMRCVLRGCMRRQGTTPKQRQTPKRAWDRAQWPYAVHMLPPQMVCRLPLPYFFMNVTPRNCSTSTTAATATGGQGAAERAAESGGCGRLRLRGAAGGDERLHRAAAGGGRGAGQEGGRRRVGVAQGGGAGGVGGGDWEVTLLGMSAWGSLRASRCALRTPQRRVLQAGQRKRVGVGGRVMMG